MSEIIRSVNAICLGAVLTGSCPIGPRGSSLFVPVKAQGPTRLRDLWRVFPPSLFSIQPTTREATTRVDDRGPMPRYRPVYSSDSLKRTRSCQEYIVFEEDADDEYHIIHAEHHQAGSLSLPDPLFRSATNDLDSHAVNIMRTRLASWPS